ncbi:uncharacterized protein LOC123518880 isoform X2 [Portunus trituberculatus]|uniref:uncharacterized protein LOC123518880 isoform X2 n=1 Tax=Portunus trituberculatus TaxID=210409 RepID=UPI001E1CF89F|nr:uncharacterized protein LOC123518880 isoform X2 [Portunus trituberculatus]
MVTMMMVNNGEKYCNVIKDKNTTTTTTTNMSPSQPRSIAFSMQVFKRYPEVIPLVTIIGGAMVGMCVWSGYALVTKTDVQVKRSGLNRWDQIDLNRPQKKGPQFITKRGTGTHLE